jgi:hypothetical protein
MIDCIIAVAHHLFQAICRVFEGERGWTLSGYNPAGV